MINVTNCSLMFDFLQNFILYSPNACFKQVEERSHIGTGSVLVIIFFVLVLIYLFLGIIVNYLLLGARGLEVLPQLDFWRGLPSLVRVSTFFCLIGQQRLKEQKDWIHNFF